MQQIDLLYRIITIIFPVFSIVAVGYLYSRNRRPDMSAGNRINMDVFVPALIFDIMSGSDFSLLSYASLAGAGCLVILGSGLLAWPIGRGLGYQWKTFVPPMMFTNSGNMGVPVILLAFGEQALPAAVVLFALENFLHFTLGQRMVNPRSSLLTIGKNPMVIATLAGITLSILGLNLPEMIRVPIHMMGQVAIPLMLFSLGVRLTGIDFRDWKIGLAGALICPLSGLVIALLILPFLALSKEQIPILMLFSVLPPAVLNYMVAEHYDQQPRLVASIVLIGNLGSLITIPLILWFVLQ
ncbi:MAG: AEC family transporter [Gammaproteobacteria bacterium]